MFKRMYDKVLSTAQHKAAPFWLWVVALIESSIFPIPPDVMLIPMCLANRAKALFYGLMATLGSVSGGILGYAIGYFAFDQIGKPLLDLYGYGARFAHFADSYNEQGIWIVLAAGLTPLPYKIFTIASGLTAMNFAHFVGASVLARGLRFMIEAWVVGRFGPPIAKFVERYMAYVSVAVFVLIIGGFALVKYVF